MSETLSDAYRLGYKAGYMAGRLDVMRGAEYDDLTPNEKTELSAPQDSEDAPSLINTSQPSSSASNT